MSNYLAIQARRLPDGRFEIVVAPEVARDLFEIVEASNILDLDNDQQLARHGFMQELRAADETRGWIS
jgi:hypothetical protein